LAPFHVAVRSIEAKVGAASKATHGLFKARFQGRKLCRPQETASLKKIGRWGDIWMRAASSVSALLVAIEQSTSPTPHDNF